MFYQSGFGMTFVASSLDHQHLGDVPPGVPLMLQRPLGMYSWCVIQTLQLLISPWLGVERHGVFMLSPLVHSPPDFAAKVSKVLGMCLLQNQSPIVEVLGLLTCLLKRTDTVKSCAEPCVML